LFIHIRTLTRAQAIDFATATETMADGAHHLPHV
jgi:hypothetical protein